MKIITCASYYGSGSSALTDLVAEYENVKDLSDFEFRFLHDIDGIRDLEYHLVENHNRHNSGHELKRFARLAYFNAGDIFSKRYSRFIDKDEYLRATEEYINSLIDFKYKGWWFFDLFDKGPMIYDAFQIVNHIFRKIPIDNLRILKNEYTFCTHPSEKEFIAATKNYISRLLKLMNSEQKEYVEIDQLVPSSNIEQYLKYFDDEIYVFIVDRDPRDVYCLGKYYWKDGICPKESDAFCKWYRYARQAGSQNTINDDRIMKIQFEDLVFKYSDTVSEVEKKLKLSNLQHTAQFDKFNPKRSIMNVKVWEKHLDDPAIGIIEQELAEYLYNYEKVDSIVPGKEVTDSSIF